MAFAPLKKLLTQRLTLNPALKTGLSAVQVCQAWNRIIRQILPPHLSIGIKAHNFKHGRLRVLVPNQVAAQELRLRENQLKSKINQAFSRPILERVVYFTTAPSY